MTPAQERRIATLTAQRDAAEKVCEAVVEIDDEGYVESMENVPSWQRLADALTEWRRTKDA